MGLGMRIGEFFAAAGKKFQTRSLVAKYGQPIGKIGKNGNRAFARVDKLGTQVITGINKDGKPIAQVRKITHNSVSQNSGEVFPVQCFESVHYDTAGNVTARASGSVDKYFARLDKYRYGDKLSEVPTASRHVKMVKQTDGTWDVRRIDSDCNKYYKA